MRYYNGYSSRGPHLKMGVVYRIRVYAIMTKGHDSCAWLVVGRVGRCGTSCLDTFCKVHLAQLRKKPGSEPRPCCVCGRGTKAETQRCSKACGADRTRYYLTQAEAHAKRLFPAVMHELLRMAERQRTLPFIGLRN